ncbi:MAG: hypothetical protein HGA90_01275 [Alphaproteobacteria bacterium]|nr:hypothetical protein [Alphaproteobacteria bacterium]
MVEVVATSGKPVNTGAARAATQPTGSYAEATSVTATQTVQPISPTMKTDPASGVLITQYLNSSGEVQMQLPSAVAIAYLRMGLSATGESLKGGNAAATEAPKSVVV